jgi:hypothetical protein
MTHCMDCKFWDMHPKMVSYPKGEPAPRREAIGKCRINPPVSLADYMQRPTTVWPSTMGYESCGKGELASA